MGSASLRAWSSPLLIRRQGDAEMPEAVEDRGGVGLETGTLLVGRHDVAYSVLYCHYLISPA